MTLLLHYAGVTFACRGLQTFRILSNPLCKHCFWISKQKPPDGCAYCCQLIAVRNAGEMGALPSVGWWPCVLGLVSCPAPV